MRRLGITLILVIPPNKSEIYQEYLPPEFSSLFQSNELNDLYKDIEKFPELNFVELKNALELEKENGAIYLKEDTHWSKRGAFLAYLEIMAKVKQFYPKAHLLKENDFNALNVLRIPPCDTARGLHLIWHKPCEDLKYTHKDSKITEIFISPFGPDKRSYKHQFPNGEIKRGSKKLEIDSKYLGVFTRSSRIESPSALIIGDSFTLALSQFLAESFQSTLLISDKNFIALTENGSFKDSYLLKTLKPDIVIFESVQRGWQGMFDLY